jgi:phage I-like protein
VGQKVTLHIQLVEGAEPPTEFRIFASGTIETTKGIFKFDEESGVTCMKRVQENGNDIVIDYEHASLIAPYSADPAEAGKAAGWCNPELREGTLWASKVRWTPKATEKLKAREFRYFSPTFLANDDGRIEELINIALTNNPATRNLEPLVASQHAEPAPKLEPEPKRPEPKEQTMPVNLKQLATDLGLAETASETEILAAVKALQTGSKRADELATELGKIVADADRREKDDVIRQAKAEGKLPPALEPWANDQSIAALRAYIAAAPKIAGLSQKREPTHPASPGAEPFTGAANAIEIKGCKLLGVKLEDYLKHKAKRMAELDALKAENAA